MPSARDRREILLQRDDRERRQVLGAHEERGPGLAPPVPLLDQRAIQEGLEDALAVLGADAPVAELDGRLERVELAVALVDDDGHPERAEPLGGVGVEGDGAVERLLDEGDGLAEARERRRLRHRLEEPREVAERLVLLVAVQRDDVGLRDETVEGRGDGLEPGEVLVMPPAHLDLEMPEPVGLDALLERLRQAVAQPAVGRDVGGRDRVEETDGVAHRRASGAALRASSA